MGKRCGHSLHLYPVAYLHPSAEITNLALIPPHGVIPKLNAKNPNPVGKAISNPLAREIFLSYPPPYPHAPGSGT